MIYHADCLEVLKTFQADSIDALVTDPPYGWRFMGKAWDSFDVEKMMTEDKKRPPRIGSGGSIRHRGTNERSLFAGTYDFSQSANQQFQTWTEQWAKEALRVLKPGGHMLVFCGPRTYHRMATGVEDAGFEIRDQLQWLFGSGFPKSHNISKAIDSHLGFEREVLGILPAGSGPLKRGHVASTGGGMSLSTERSPEIEITEAASYQAKQWQGWGTALKPANEPILLARKPISEKTVAANVLKFGTGGINIDASRIDSLVLESEKRTSQSGIGIWNQGSGPSKLEGEERHNPAGRFPANLILSHNPECFDARDACIDEKTINDAIECAETCAVQMLDEQSGKTSKTGKRTKNFDYQSKGLFPLGSKENEYTDSGGASRFFYCAKTSKSERNAGCEDITSKTWKEQGFRDNETTHLSPRAGAGRTSSNQNHHPTVKPKKLMSYLIRMITPPGGTCLDPFMGSGSTGVACAENGFQFIGIEKELEYFQIAEKRIAHGIENSTPAQANLI